MQRNRRRQPSTAAILFRTLTLVIVAGLAIWTLWENLADEPLPPPSPYQTRTEGNAIFHTGDWYALAFTLPQPQTARTDRTGGIDTLLVEVIDQAERTIDVAAYDFDLETVSEALANAQRRGVQVRMVLETDTLENADREFTQAAIQRVRDAEIPIVDDRRPAYMHNKFTIVDGEWVSTGSWNYSHSETYRANNWVGVFRSQALAENYTIYFNELFERRRFAGSGRVQLPHATIKAGSSTVSVCFSPAGGCVDRIVQAIERAEQSVKFMAFSFTSDPIGLAMLGRHRAGVAVEGIFETTGSNTQHSEFGMLRDAGVPVYTDGNPGNMHHKVIVVDSRLVIAGSYNFSANAERDNNENLLFIDDPVIAAAFEEEYARVKEVAKPGTQ